MVPGLDVLCGGGRMSVIKLYFQALQIFLTFWVCFLLGVKEMYDDTAADGHVLKDPFSDVTPRSKREVARRDTAGWH